MTETEKKSSTTSNDFVSTLHRGRERFLAHVIEQGLELGCRTPKDFIRHFPPATIMAGLEKRPALRAKILVEATGIRDRIAVKKSATSAGEDLQIALDEQETDADTVVANFDPDDRIRYLEASALWSYITEPLFWEVSKNDTAEYERSKFFVSYLIDRAITDELLSHGDIVDSISVTVLSELLPRNELELVINAAIKLGREGKPFTDVDFFKEIPSTTLVEHVPLPLIWNKVIVPLVAEVHGFVEQKQEDGSGLNKSTQESEGSGSTWEDTKSQTDANLGAGVGDKAGSAQDQGLTTKDTEQSLPYALRSSRKKVRGPKFTEKSDSEGNEDSRKAMESEEPTSVSELGAQESGGFRPVGFPFNSAKDKTGSGSGAEGATGEDEHGDAPTTVVESAQSQTASASKRAAAPPPLPIKR